MGSDNIKDRCAHRFKQAKAQILNMFTPSLLRTPSILTRPRCLFPRSRSLRQIRLASLKQGENKPTLEADDWFFTERGQKGWVRFFLKDFKTALFLGRSDGIE